MQRETERLGIPTASPSVARDVTERAKPPRALFLPFMMGHHFGVPHHRELQRRILMELLDLVQTAEQSGTIREFDYTWARARREGKQIEAGG